MLDKFDQLKVVQETHELVKTIYQLTQSFPKTEEYRLKDQLCRSASSVPANIVEGHSRKTKKEFIQYLYQAKGSLAETQYHLWLAKDLGLISTSTYQNLIQQSDTIGKMISGFIKYLKQ